MQFLYYNFTASPILVVYGSSKIHGVRYWSTYGHPNEGCTLKGAGGGGAVREVSLLGVQV